MKRPSYATALAARLATGWRPADGTIYAAVGPQRFALAETWKGDQWRAFIAIHEPCDLSIVKGWPVIFYGCGATDDELQGVAADLVRAGAELAIGAIGGRYISFRGVRA